MACAAILRGCFQEVPTRPRKGSNAFSFIAARTVRTSRQGAEFYDYCAHVVAT